MESISFMESGNASDGGKRTSGSLDALNDVRARLKGEAEPLRVESGRHFQVVPPTSKGQIRQRKPNVDDDEDELVA